jgi:hypothetical protein
MKSLRPLVTRWPSLFLLDSSALKLFEIGRLSASRAAALRGMDRADFLLRVGQSGTPVIYRDERDGEEFSS